MTEPVGEDAERVESIGWLELFFDLVVVAAVAVLAEGLREQTDPALIGRVALVYAIIWLSWATTVLYANVAQEKTRMRTMTIAMLLIAVMTAAAPVDHADHADVFVIAFLVLRSILGRSALQTGRVLGSWPLLQFGGMTIIWLGSLWVPTPWKYWVWLAALVLDIGSTMLFGRGEDTGERAVSAIRARSEQRARRAEHGSRPGREARSLPEIVAVEIDRGHLDERLGLFVIIVLGEAVIQVVHAAHAHEWTGHFVAVALAAFITLLALWRHTFAFGFTGTPHVSLAVLPPRLGLPLHLAATAGLIALAAGMADLAPAADERIHPITAVLVGAGLGLFLGVSLVAALLGPGSRSWALTRALPAVAWCAGLAILGRHAHPVALAWLAVLPAVWIAGSGRRESGGRSENRL